MNKKSDKNTRRKRPLSPHLTIYKPQITSVLSITHRATGVFLFFGAFMFVWELYAASSGVEAMELYMKFATSGVGVAIAALWILSLFYHLFNGIRHLFWDVGLGFDLNTITISGIMVVLLTLVCTVFIRGYIFGGVL